ncbi:MAG: adenosylcobinamide-phosphate synthase CbiB [Pseudomonadota bacterium]
MIQLLILWIAFIADWVFGDPRRLPHLIVGFGKLISLGDALLNQGRGKRVKGAVLVLVLVLGTYFGADYLLETLRLNSDSAVYVGLSSLLMFYCLSNRSLIDAGKRVFSVLLNKGVEEGRKALSMIVGRETDKLNSQQIRAATLETMSENLSDGVIAPLFYFCLLGVPGAMAYKMINTLDSMIAYKTPVYKEFGLAAARLDDLANFIPARLTAMLMLISRLRPQGIFFVGGQAKKHLSPNAGYPEAALAYLLNIRLGGPSYYHGKLIEKEYLGSGARKIAAEDIVPATRINLISSVLAVVCISIYLYATSV